MVASFSRLLCGVALLQAFVASSPLPFNVVPRYFQKEPSTRSALSPLQVQKELGSTLSVHATIIGPNDPAFANITRRWNYVAPPQIELAVQAGEEEDIAKIVRYCNDNSIKFLAVNRGHGFSGAYKRFKGVQIDLKQLERITIHEDEQTATFQGGVWAPEIMHTLWDNGNYLTPTGSHACVGYLGPAMGGGHGRLEGLYGLVADNLLHLNVVLADGKTIQVNKTSHADLYWAIKGAGHNFGIVTHAKVKIYKSLNPTWHWHNYIWKQDKLETVLTELNKIQDGGKAPRLLAGTFGQVLYNKSVSDTEPVLSWQFAYYGPAADAEKILQPFNKIPAVWTDQGDVPYPEVVYPQQTYLCPSGKWVISSAMTKTWNITAERRNYNNFVRNAASYPEFAATAQIVYQGYATAGMQDIDADSTAYAHRDQYHTALLQGLVPEGQSVERAEAWAKEAVDEWQAGQPGVKLSTYPNYSVGAPYETLESIYGYEPWRLQRLRKLKAKYDPHNRFRYHVPIIPEKN